MIREERHAGRSALVESYIVTNGLQPAVRLSAISHPNKRQRHYVRTLPINALKVLGESRGASFKKPLWRIPRVPRIPRIPRIPLRVGETEERGETVGAVGEVEIGE